MSIKTIVKNLSRKDENLIGIYHISQHFLKTVKESLGAAGRIKQGT